MQLFCFCPFSDGLEIKTSARVAQQLSDGRLRVEHTSQINREGETTRIVTLTGTIDSTFIATDITPNGTPIYASPGAEPQLTTEATTMLRLTLSDIKGLKLRAWTLSEEIGD